VTAEGSPRVGTASVNLDSNMDVTISLSEPSPTSPFDVIRETFIEPLQSLFAVQNFLFSIMGFACLPVGVTVGWYGFSEEENWIKIVSFLIALLGVVIIVYALIL